MLYTTPLYLPFLAVVVGLYWLVIPAHLRRHCLVAVSLLLLSYLEWRSTVALLGLSLYVWLMGRAISRTSAPNVRATLLGLALVVPVAYLATFKYLPAYAPPIAKLLGNMTAAGLLLPLGISYFTFKFIHYLIESRRGTLPKHDFWDFLCYVALFTMFPAGPIERFPNLAPQLAAPNFDTQQFARGLQRIFQGMVKKIVIADLLLAVALDGLGDVGSDFQERSAATQLAWLWLRLLHLYFDFSGYSDIAIGTSQLFGLRIMENFDWPLVKRNISAFWRSWHISLSSWCRDYVFLPVFGLTRNPRIAVFASMLVLGYWHGAHPKWLLWGAWHATGLALWQVWQVQQRRRPALARSLKQSRTWDVTAWAITMNFVAIGGVWTSFDSPWTSVLFLVEMLTP